MREESEPPVRRSTGCKTALPPFISPSKTESCRSWRMECDYGRFYGDKGPCCEARRSASVVAEVSWTRQRPRDLVVGVDKMELVC